MKTVTGVFTSRSDAERALEGIRLLRVSPENITLLSPGSKNDLRTVPTAATEQPGVGKAIGAVIGASAGLSGGALAAAVLLPGVGAVTAIGLLGEAILAAAGAGVGAVAGGKLENATTDGLPEDEFFVY